MSAVGTFFNDLFQSIFTPGPTPSLLIATNVSFACLQVVLLILLVATYSIHFLILSIISGGLWWAINWFVAEVNSFKKSQEELAKKAQDAGDDTETEGEAIIHTRKDNLGSREVEPMEASGELKERRSMGGSRSGLSTEDEWEQVSENEKDK